MNLRDYDQRTRDGRVVEGVGTDRAWPDTEVRFLPRPPLNKKPR